jgi:hypothetical protein
MGDPEVRTHIFTRFYIPVVLSLLVLAFVAVLIRSSPGLPLSSVTGAIGRSGFGFSSAS